jgi:hypothetical protein
MKAHLVNNGYQVVDMAECIRPVEAVIFHGELLDDNKKIKCAKGTMVINANGLDFDQVVNQIEGRY